MTTADLRAMTPNGRADLLEATAAGLRYYRRLLDDPDQRVRDEAAEAVAMLKEDREKILRVIRGEEINR